MNFNYFHLLISKIINLNYFKKIRETSRKYLGISFRLFIIDLILVILLGIYVSKLLFGSSSLEVLNSLKKERKILKEDIKKMKIYIQKAHEQYLRAKYLSNKKS